MFSKGNKKDTRIGTPSKPAMPSIIGPDMKIIGNLISDGEIQIDGAVEGDIQAKRLLIGQTANITGEVIGDVVRVHGRINGQIRAKAVTLAKTAKMTGDILHENLSIEEGAYLEGHCRRIEKQTVTKVIESAAKKSEDAAPAKPLSRTPQAIVAR